MGDPMQYPEATMGWSGKAGWARSVFGVRDIRDYEIPEANLFRLTYWSETAIGQNVTQIDYSDFRSVLGTRVPFHWTVASSIGFSSINVVDLAQNTPVDDSRFARPPR
jgi:hypothetical protein